MTTPTTDAREREAETPSDSPQLAALYVAIVRYGTVREAHPGDFHVRDEAAGVVGAAIEEWYTAVRATALAEGAATERARVRAVVEGAPGYQRQGLFVSRADILARLDAEPTP